MKTEKISPQEQKRNEAYNEYVKQVTPTHNLWINMLKAFFLGGLICTIGQFIVNTGMNNFGLEQKEASTWCSLILILCSVILTSLNLYPSLSVKGRWILQQKKYLNSLKLDGVGYYLSLCVCVCV